MYKEINWDGYNLSTIVKIYENGGVLCNLFYIDENGNILKYDMNISFPADNLLFEFDEMNWCKIKVGWR